MFRNYLKTALRNLWRNRTYGLLNILGLAVGVTCAALIFLWVQHEVTYDHNQLKRDRLYLLMNNQSYDGQVFTFGSTPGPLGPALKAEIPGIVNTARSVSSDPALFSRGEKAIYENGSYVDPSYFAMFTYEFVKGTAASPFPELHTLIISETMARKFFSDENPIGQPLKLNNAQTYTVAGVFRDQPANSSFSAHWFAPFEVFKKQNAWLETWGNNGIQTFVELAPGTDVARVNAQLHDFIRQHGNDPKAVSSPLLFAMNDWRLRSHFANGVQDGGGRIEYVRMFSLVAGFILLIACINFMNLATARSEKRAREVGMRKVLGGTRGMLIGQFLGESLLLSFFAVLVAVVLTWAVLPMFNLLVEKQLALDLTSPIHLGALLGIALLTGLLAGSYPALYLSGFAPVAVLKGLRLNTGAGAGFVRKGLVVFQFTTSIVLIVGTVIVYQQIQYVKARELGYARERLIYTNVNDNSPGHISALRNELLATGVVENAGLSSGSTLELHSNGGGVSWEGKDPGQDILITHERVSPSYRATIGLKLLAGRDFRPDMLSDSTNVIINQTMAQLMKKAPADALGAVLTHEGGESFTVVGVVQDFLFNDFYKAPEPLMMYARTDWASTLSIRLKPGADLTASLAKVGDVMKTANPGYPFEYKFVDEEFARHFQSETLIGKLAGVFAGLAIVISCLGLFGLAAYTAERRTREIGIRKVLGAPVQSLVGLLSKDFLQLVGFACLVAFPLAWWATSRWLDSYAYRTPISWWVFGLAGLLALLIALLTVSFQAVKAALANPVKSLRSE